MAGQLFIVGTPIGHLGDTTERAIETLRSVSHVFAEDTRRTRALLGHYGIDGKKVIALHAHSSERALALALEILEAGHAAALVTDAGMPGVSDPGAEIVRAARNHGIPISVVPGPSAVTAAVALSGLVNGPFTFLGFLPRKGSSRREALLEIQRSRMPTVLFESPHRAQRTFEELAEVCEPEREVAVCRELTKHFEETLVLSLEELSRIEREWRGELTLVVARGPLGASAAGEDDWDVDSRIEELLAAGTSVKETVETVSGELSRRGQKTRKKDIYARVLHALSSRDLERQDLPTSEEEEVEEEDGADEEIPS